MKEYRVKEQDQEIWFDYTLNQVVLEPVNIAAVGIRPDKMPPIANFCSYCKADKWCIEP